jgi:predicted RNA-binding Zn ribbon-like protein
MLWDSFINSEWHDCRCGGSSEYSLYTPGWLEHWLDKQHLSVSRLPESGEMASLKRLRSLLHGMVEQIVAGGAPSSDQIEEINRVMTGGPVTRQIAVKDDVYSLQFTAVRRDWRLVMAEIAYSFSRTLAEGETSRFRICDNADCRWVYYDDTRNRSKRYCEDKSCGNLMKVRRFRARHKASGESSGQEHVHGDE